MNEIDFYSRLSSAEKPISSEKASSDIDFYSRKPVGKTQKPVRGKVEKLARGAAQYGLGAAETALLPYELAVSPLKSKSAQQVPYRENLFEDIERLSLQKQSGDWDAKDEELLQSLIEQARDPRKSEKFIKTADIGVGDLAEKASKKLFDYELSPEGFGENALRIGGNILKPSTITKGISKIPSLGKQIADKELRHVIKEKNNWSRLAKSAEGDLEKQTMLNLARDSNLSPEAASLIMKSRGNLDYLEAISRKTGKLKNVVSELKEKLGKNYEELKRFGKEGGVLDKAESGALQGDLQKILNEMQATTVVSEESKPIIKTLEEAQQKINEGVTIKELINSRRALTKVKFNNITEGSFFRGEAKQAYLDAIKRKNPAIAERLVQNDNAYSKYKMFEDVLAPRQPRLKFKGVELPSWTVEAIGFAMAPFIPHGITAATALSVIPRISTAMIINPKLQPAWKVWKKSMMNGSKEGVKKAFLMSKNILKRDDPDLYEDMKDLKME